MIEYFLQHSEIFCLFIEPIAEGFPHGVSPDGLYIGKISGFLQLSISLDLTNELYINKMWLFIHGFMTSLFKLF